MVACTTKCVQAVDALLLHGADVTASNKDRVTALMSQVKPNSNIPSVNDDDDEGPKDVTDDEADVLYDTFPLFRTMGISLAHFALHELDGLSMAQLDMLQDAHMHAFTVIGDKKVQVARQLEADRIHAAYELEQHIFNLG
ncbi:hypothetical protein DYB28_013925 [Aphanomyces astaci]|uniref:Uncharacterized protein n=1 Tax=Aphanomyces astaci TaxID=112090 RepID=A0A9X8DR05_APHAT|nr:hypothetical protein DYB28_013925 [Aphanomyces astaci]